MIEIEKGDTVFVTINLTLNKSHFAVVKGIYTDTGEFIYENTAYIIDLNNIISLDKYFKVGEIVRVNSPSDDIHDKLVTITEFYRSGIGKLCVNVMDLNHSHKSFVIEKIKKLATPISIGDTVEINDKHWDKSECGKQGKITEFFIGNFGSLCAKVELENPEIRNLQVSCLTLIEEEATTMNDEFKIGDKVRVCGYPTEYTILELYHTNIYDTAALLVGPNNFKTGELLTNLIKVPPTLQAINDLTNVDSGEKINLACTVLEKTPNGVYLHINDWTVFVPNDYLKDDNA